MDPPKLPRIVSDLLSALRLRRKSTPILSPAWLAYGSASDGPLKKSPPWRVTNAAKDIATLISVREGRLWQGILGRSALARRPKPCFASRISNHGWSRFILKSPDESKDFSCKNPLSRYFATSPSKNYT